MKKVKIIECPRDAMQGIREFIPTDKKAEYINSLLNVGFDTLDFGSFVSPHAIPQMADTALVLSKLNLEDTNTKLLAIVANVRGAQEAAMFEGINYLGFPFSISETFQKRNTNSTIEQSLVTVDKIQNLCVKYRKEFVIYISMGFGNPYGDKWNDEIVMHWVKKIHDMGIRIISLADTVGTAVTKDVAYLFSHVIPEFPSVEFGAHFHTKPGEWKEKIDAAYNNGCTRFDGALKGYGGCPMAEDKLTGNMPTENLISYFAEKDIELGINTAELSESMRLADSIFH